MFKEFRRAQKEQSKSKGGQSKLHPVLAAEKILSVQHRREFINKINEVISFDAKEKELYIKPVFDSIGEFLQFLPETKNSYFAQAGGFLDHALERTIQALPIARELFVAEGEDSTLSQVQNLWIYALFSASMFYGIGTVLSDFSIELFDTHENYLDRWSPLDGMMKQQGASFYDYDLEPAQAIEFRRRGSLLLARQLMPEKGFQWIASDIEVLSCWLALIEEDAAGAGTLGPILIRADALAINRDLSQKEGKEGFKFSKMTQAFSTPGGRTGESNITAQDSITGGPEFIKWLTSMLNGGRVMINQSPLFMVPGGMLMCPDIFKLFVRAHPEFKSWQAVQQAFLNLQLHARSAEGKAVQRFTQLSNQQQHSGVVLAKVDAVLPSQVKVKSLTGGQVKTMSAKEVASSAQLRQGLASSSSAMKTQYLSANGQWGDKKSPVKKQDMSRQK